MKHTLTTTQLNAMLKLQAAMNAKVNPEWRAANYPFLRANVIEGGEAIDHHGWKWWKKQEKDVPQLAIELVDIWHFTLSHLIVQHGEESAAIAIHDQLATEYCRKGLMFDGAFFEFAKMDTLGRLELLIGLSVSRRVSIPLFEALLDDVDMTWEHLYKGYVGKNVLNFFRQDNGYKQGAYVKIWDGKEDNVHLVEIMATLDDDDPEFPTHLYTALKSRYRSPILEAAE